MNDRHTASTINDEQLDELYARIAEFDHIINWHTTCASCARILDSAYAETVRAEKAEATLARVRTARERIAHSRHADAIYCLDALDEALGITPPGPAATEAAETTARVSAGLHHSAEQDVTRVINLYEQWVKAGPPPLGVPLSRWWDRRLIELHQAIHPTAEQPRTTANNPATSGDAANNPLLEQLAAALSGADEHSCQIQDGPDYQALAEAALAIHRRDTAQLRRERDMALKAAREARGVVGQVRAALTGEFMAGPNAVMVVRVDTVRAALDPKESP